MNACAIAYAPCRLDVGRPWLLELDPVRGTVVAYLDEGEYGPLHARRNHCSRRVHASLTSACNAYNLDAARDIELRWWKGVSLATVVEVECQRLKLAATVQVGHQAVTVVDPRRAYRIANAYELRQWCRQTTEGPKRHQQPWG